MPAVTIALSLEVEAKTRVIWNSAAAGPGLDPVIEVYCPLYVKMWEYPDGPRVSPLHLCDGRFVASVLCYQR